MEAGCASGQPIQQVAFVKLTTKVLYTLQQKGKDTASILRCKFAFCVFVLFFEGF